MKKIFILTLFCLTSQLFAAGPSGDPMVLNYELNNSVGSVVVWLGKIAPGDSVFIFWNDEDLLCYYDTGYVSFSKTLKTDKTIKIYDGLLKFGSYGKDFDPHVISVSSWGSLPLTNLNSAFYNAENLISVPSSLPPTVTDISFMFQGTSVFDGDISNWDISNVTSIVCMFSNAKAFNGDLNNWDVSNLTNMTSMFDGAISFNRDLNNWNVSNVTNMHNMFKSATAFNGDISNWDVSNVTNMRNMFKSATAFNGDISNWDVSKVPDMSELFFDAKAFNGDLSSWNVSSVNNMVCMFYYATSFNSDISSWDVSSVTSLSSTFRGASSFNCDISSWDISRVTSMSNMLDNSAISVTNYDMLLKKWLSQSPLKNVNLGAKGVLYSRDAVEFRNELINKYGWIIEGDSLVETTFTVLYDENYLGGIATETEQFSPVAKYVSPSYFPKRHGYKLAGWNSKPDGSGYAFDNSIKITEDITFYAQWVKGTAIIQTDTTTLTGVKGLLVSPNPVPQSEEKVTLVIPSDLSGSWKIGVYDVLGNELDDAIFEAQGGTSYEWDLRNKSGVKVGGGSYVLIATHTDESGIVKTFKRTVGVAR